MISPHVWYLVPAIKSFTVTIKGRKPIALSWSTKPATATLKDLLKCIYNEDSSLDHSLRSVTVDKAGCSDIIYLDSDEQLRTHLIDMVCNGIEHLTIRLEDRAYSIIELAKSDTDRIYGCQSYMISRCLGDDSQPSPEYLNDIDDIVNDVVKSLMTIMQVTDVDESGRALETFASEVNFAFLSNVILHLFPELRLERKTISGWRGAGAVDYMVVTRDGSLQKLPVNTSGHRRGNPLYETMVQLDAIQSGQKRKFDEVDNHPTPSVSYGIFSDGISFGFLECRSDVLNESGFNKPKFLLTECSSRMKATGGKDELKASVRCIIGHFVCQLMSMVDDLPYKNNQTKTETICRKKKGAIHGKK